MRTLSVVISLTQTLLEPRISIYKAAVVVQTAATLSGLLE